MNLRTFFRNLFSYKLLAVIALGYLIPQVVYLAIKLTWALTIIIAVFLSCELLIVLIVRVWLPHRVNVPQIMEWTITTLLRVGSSLCAVLCQVLYSCFDLLFGRVLQTGPRKAPQRRIELRPDSPGKILADQKMLSNKYGLGYTPMARIAMTNSAIKTNKPARFSL